MKKQKPFRDKLAVLLLVCLAVSLAHAQDQHFDNQHSGNGAGRKLKQTTKQAVFDSPFQPPVSYMASGGIGLRWSQHYFDNPLDMGFIDGQHHLEESRTRRLQNIRIHTAADVMSEETDDGQFDQFEANTTPLVYLSHIYYTQRWDTHDAGTHGIATAQNGFLAQVGVEQTCIQEKAEAAEEIDLAKEVIRSNRIRMGLAQYGTREDLAVLRSSSLMSLAFDWVMSCELPIDRIEQNENEQLIEAFFSKMAKTHQVENFKHFESLLTRSKNSADKADYWQSFFTVDQPMHPVSKPGGILEGVQAIDITKLSKAKQPEAYSFFREKLMVQPNFITFNQISILQPEQRKFTITNVQTKGDIKIENILTCSPEVLVYLPKNSYYPVTLRPGENITFSVVVAPETWGLLQTAIVISFSNLMNLMLPVTSFHIANDYELDPIYYTNVNVGEQVQGQIKIKNPSSTEELEIVEVYSTEEYLKLYWPNSVQLASASEAQSNRDFSKYLKIEPGAKAKSILNFRFETDQMVDHRAVIHMVTNFGDVLRIPLYFHIYPDLLKFTPSIVDFGIVPFRFDALRVPVVVSIRNGFDIGLLYLNEVLLPVSDKRLDFVMGKWDRDSYGNIQVYNKQSMRLEEHRRGILHKDRSLELFTVVLNPIAYGEINTQVVLVFTTEEGHEYRVELPIVGHVLKQNNLLVEDQFGSGQPEFSPWSVAKPAITLNVKSYQNDIATQTSTGQLLKSKKVEERLIIFNNLGSDIQGLEVVNVFSEAAFAYQSGSSSKQQGSSKSALLSPGQSIQLGSLFINLKDLKTTSGHHYFFLQTNQNLFLPMMVQISDSNLVCSWAPADLHPTRHQDCQSGIHLDYRNLALNQPSFKYINMTNIGSEPVQIDWLSTTGDNELFLTFKSLDPPHIPGAPDFPLNKYRGLPIDYIQKRIGAWLQPQQTVVMEIGLEAYPHSINLVSQRKMTFQFSPSSYGQLKIDVTFNAQAGSASFLPKKSQLTFPATYVGAATLQTHVIMFQSTLSKPVHIKQIILDNPQFKIQTVNSKLRNGVEVVRILFDPNERQAVQGVAVAIKNATDNSLIIQRVTNQETPPLGRDQKPTSQIGKFTPIVTGDITKYRNTQEQLFAKRKKSESKVVTATLTIETDQLSTVQYKLVGEITQPQILSQDSIDFGKVQIGSSTAHTLVITNPYAEPLQVQIYVGRATSEIEAELKRLKLIASAKSNRVMSGDNASQDNQVLQIILSKLNYTRFHCSRVISDPLLDDSGSKPNTNTVNQDDPQELHDLDDHHDQQDLDNLQDEDAPILLTRESPKDMTCAQVTDLLTNYETVEAFEEDRWLWLQIEEYFRQIILISANFESNMNMDSFSKDQLENLGLLQQLELLIEQLVYNAESSLIEENQIQPVDQQILADLLWCSQQRPLLDHNQTLWLHVTQRVGFPNVIDYYFPVRPAAHRIVGYVTTPFTWSMHLAQNVMAQETWFDAFQCILDDSSTVAIDIFNRIFVANRKSVQMRPEDFLATRQKDKTFMPAATTTNSIQFLDPMLHSELVRNNGTIGVDRNTQSFFLNPSFNKMLTIPPHQNLSLPAAIVYEPHALISSDVQHQMLVYVKTDHTPLQTLQVTGSASSAVLEMTQVLRVTGDNRYEHISTNVAMSPHLCRQLGEKQPYPKNLPLCKNQLETSELVHQQIFGKSQITSLIQLRIDIKDAIGSQEKEESFRIAANNFLTRMKTFFNQASRHMLNLEPQTETPNLPSVYNWKVLFTNIGNENFLPTKIGFEDPSTGQISCVSGDLQISPCFLDLIQAEDYKYLFITLNADYSTAVYKKTLVFQSSSFIQRFPLQVTTDQKVLDFASHFGRNNQWTSEFTRSIAMVIITVLLLTFKQVQRLQNLPALQTVPLVESEPIQLVLQSQVLMNYQQVSDRFRMHNTQFMREVTNLGKGKTNSAWTDYQRGVVAKKPAQQTAVNLHRIRMPRQTALISPEESLNVSVQDHSTPVKLQETGGTTGEQHVVAEVVQPSQPLLVVQPQPQQTTPPIKAVVVQEEVPESKPVVSAFNPIPQPPPQLKPSSEPPTTTSVPAPPVPPAQSQPIEKPAPAATNAQTTISRMNKKERRAYEQKRKEAELALATQIELQKVLLTKEKNNSDKEKQQMLMLSEEVNNEPVEVKSHKVQVKQVQKEAVKVQSPAPEPYTAPKVVVSHKPVQKTLVKPSPPDSVPAQPSEDLQTEGEESVKSMQSFVAATDQQTSDKSNNHLAQQPENKSGMTEIIGVARHKTTNSIAREGRSSSHETSNFDERSSNTQREAKKSTFKETGKVVAQEKNGGSGHIKNVKSLEEKPTAVVNKPTGQASSNYSMGSSANNEAPSSAAKVHEPQAYLKPKHVQSSSWSSPNPPLSTGHLQKKQQESKAPTQSSSSPLTFHDRKPQPQPKPAAYPPQPQASSQHHLKEPSQLQQQQLQQQWRQPLIKEQSKHANDYFEKKVAQDAREYYVSKFAQPGLTSSSAEPGYCVPKSGSNAKAQQSLPSFQNERLRYPAQQQSYWYDQSDFIGTPPVAVHSNPKQQSQYPTQQQQQQQQQPQQHAYHRNKRQSEQYLYDQEDEYDDEHFEDHHHYHTQQHQHPQHNNNNNIQEDDEMVYDEEEEDYAEEQLQPQGQQHQQQQMSQSQYTGSASAVQYQHYQKRPYWEDQNSYQRKQTNQQQQPAFTQKGQYSAGAGAKQTSSFVRAQPQPQQTVFQPKTSQSLQSQPVEPTRHVSQIGISQQQSQVNYWKAKEPKAPKEQKIVTQPQDLTVPPANYNSQSQIEVEEEKHQYTPTPQEAQPVSNFYNAFKSIQSMFNQKARVADSDTSQSRNQSGSRQDDQEKEKPSFNSLFFSQESLFQSRLDRERDEQPRFSLFGDKIWGGNSTSLYQDQPSSSQQRGTNYQFQNSSQVSSQEKQRELFKPQAQQAVEPMLQFKPLRQYNTMFTDSLETLTSGGNKKSVVPQQQPVVAKVVRPVELAPRVQQPVGQKKEKDLDGGVGAEKESQQLKYKLF